MIRNILARLHPWPCWGLGLWFILLSPGPLRGALGSDELRERGVLFYVPFEGTAEAAVAVGRAAPWAQRSLAFVPGKIGQALHVRSEEARYVTDAQGKVVKDASGQSIIAYEALGNVFNRRGALALWVRTPWAGTDRHMLTGSSFSGPYVLSISGEGIWSTFFYLWRRKSFFDCCFEGERRAGDLARFGTYGEKLVPLWQKDVWQHVAVTWDDRRGYALYFNGEVVDSCDQPMAWDLCTPDLIALGTFPLHGRDVWPVSSEFLFDEFLIFNRPLNEAEVQLVRDGRYSELRQTTPEDWPFDPEARRRQFHLEPTPHRPVAAEVPEVSKVPKVPKVSAARNPQSAIRNPQSAISTLEMRQVPVEEIDLSFHRRYTLIDGSEETEVHFRDGGLLFDRPARFLFRKPEVFNHLVATAAHPKGSFCFDDPAKPLYVLLEGWGHVPLPPRQRREFGIFFKGDCLVREVRFFQVGPPGPERAGMLHFLAEPIAANRFEDASRVLLRWPHPDDQPALLTAAAAPDAGGPGTLVPDYKRNGTLVPDYKRNGTLVPDYKRHVRRAFHPTFFVLDAVQKDRFVETLRLLLWIRPAQPAFTAALRVYDPQIPNRAAFDLDLEVRMPEVPALSCLTTNSREPTPLDLRISAPGLVIPAGGHAVVHFVADVDYELFYGGDATPSRLELSLGDPARIGHELAQATLLNLWPAYLRRINQNRFMVEGETEETNPIKRALDLALKYDPHNPQAQAWYGWSRLRPWPPYDFRRVEKQPGPRWAVYGREAVRSAQALIHWWLDHRAHSNGYLVGGGNQWNDITQLYENFTFLCAVAGDKRLLDAVERYLDAHWNTGRMVRGYYLSLTDITHSAEEAALLQPHLTFLRPGVPRHVYRDLLTAANLKQWMGVNARGHTHFRSNFFTAEKMDTSGVFGQDVPMCESATPPARNLVWYNGHPELSQLLAGWSRSWVEDTLREEGEKPAGALPAAVQFESDALVSGWGVPSLMYDQFAAAYQVSGDREFLRPFEALLEKREALGNPKWYNHHALNLVSYRLLSGDSRHDDLLRGLARQRLELCQQDNFFQRGIENSEGEGLLAWVIDRREEDLLELLQYVARNNRRALPIYGPTDPPTDRVYPWGRAVLPVMMLGGRLLDSRASDPFPTAAFLWENIDPDVVSLVFRHEARSVTFLVHNFKSRTVEAGLRLLRLPEGTYRLALRNFGFRISDCGFAGGSQFAIRNSQFAIRKATSATARRPAGPLTVREVEMRRFTPTRLSLKPGTTYVELACLRERSGVAGNGTTVPDYKRPDLAVTLAEPPQAGRVVAHVHNLGGAPARNVVVHLIGKDGILLATNALAEIPALTGFDPQMAAVTLAWPGGSRAEEGLLVVDPQNEVDEINESNNRYPVALGVPPPVESSPGQPMF